MVAQVAPRQSRSYAVRVSHALLADARQTTFEVVCAGEPLWKRAHAGAAAATASIVEVAKLLARRQLRVGLATVLDDDTLGRSAIESSEASGVDVRGVTLAPAHAKLVVVDAAGGQMGVLAERGADRQLEIPPRWSSRVLLLSGLSPITSKAAAMCKAARRARREGTIVVLDVSAGLRQWADADARVISTVVRESDVVRSSVMELAMLGADAAAVRRAMRPGATLVVSDGADTTVTGPFGELRVRASLSAKGSEACTAALCADLARPRRAAESDDARWHRVLRPG